MANATTAPTGGYGSKIDQLLKDIDNYGEFKYSGEATYKNILDQLLGYGDFKYGQQGAYDAALDKANNYGSFTYDKQGAYDDVMQRVVNPEKFSYDPNTDPMWSAYRKTYLREGDRAAKNAIAQASVATGGVPSSYAVTAAQQAQNYYNGALADALPTLEQNAYQRHQGDYQNQLSAMGVLMNDRQNAYGQWQNGYNIAQQTLGNMQTDRQNAYQQYLDRYGMLQTGLGAVQSDREQEYGQWGDGLALLQQNLGNYQGQDATAYGRQQDAYGNLLTLITTTGYVPDAATLAAAGMTAEEAAAWKAYYDQANAPKGGRVVDSNTGGGDERFFEGWTDREWRNYFAGFETADLANAEIDALIAEYPELAYFLPNYRRVNVGTNGALSSPTAVPKTNAASQQGKNRQNISIN